MPGTNKKSVPAFFQQARTFYADAFEHRRKADLADAMAEWGELDDAEQSFALAHLAYLQLEAQAGTQQLLTHIRGLLDELAEAFTLAVEASMADPTASEATDEGVRDSPPEAVEIPHILDAEPEGTS